MSASPQFAIDLGWIIIIIQIARIACYTMLAKRLKSQHALVAKELSGFSISANLSWLLFIGSWKVNRFVWSGRYRSLNDDRLDLYCRAWQYLSFALLPVVLLVVAIVVPHVMAGR